jgi:predicted NBD/HSP70 family sugar kinase
MVLIPKKMRRLNERTLIGRLQSLGVASRADLAKALGMSQPTAGKIVDKLLARGILEEVESADAGPPRNSGAPNRLGRPGRMLRLDRRRPRFLAMELGVAETRLAVLPVGAEADDRWSLQVATPGSAEAWLRQLRAAAARIHQQHFWGVLVSVPGLVDEPAGRVLFSPNLHWTERVELPKLIGRVWSAPVLLVQEERALALGHQSADPRGDDFLLVDFGEGVGGAVIVGGKPYTNPLPISGELGHTPVPGNQRPCGCGAVGCLETLVSSRGLLASFGAASRACAPAWPALAQHVAERGVVPWLAEALETTGAVIAGALNVLGLRRVVITGCLVELPGLVMEHLSAVIKRGAMWARFGEVMVQAAPRRRTAGLVAAGLDRLVLPMPGGLRAEAGPTPSERGAETA